MAARLPGLHALDVQFRHVAQRLLERRPVLCLIGRQLETGLERSDACVGECRHILRARPIVLLRSAARRVPAGSTETLLRIDDRRAGNRKRCCRD